MDPIVTSALTSFVTAVATNSSKAPMQTLDDLWFLAFDKLNHLVERKKAKNQLALEEYKNSIAQKVLTIDDNNLQEPPMSVVGPALEASKYYIEEETLREMFANVIAASMDKNKSSNVHHSFVEIIKQLSSEDANNLTLFKEQENHAITQFISNAVDGSGYSVIHTNVFHGNLTDIYTGNENATSTTNLNRLGLVSISYEENFTDKSRYDIFRNSHLFNAYNNYDDPNHTYEFKEGIIRLTPLGRSFIRVCL